MMTCAEAARVMSDRMNRPVGWRARMALRFHLLLCSGCRHYESQLKLMREWLRAGRLDRSLNAEHAAPQLDAEARARIQAALEVRLKEKPGHL